MKSRLIQISFILMLLVQGAFSVEITGNHLFTDKDLGRFFNANAPDDSIKSKIESLYRGAGYFGAKVDISSNHDGQKSYAIVEGNPARIDSIHIELVPPSNTINFNDMSNSMTGRLASRPNLDEFANGCIKRLSESGMPFANGQWRDFQFDTSGNVTAIFRITTGPATRIAGVEFDGIKRTKASIIRKMLTLKSGESFSETKATESEHLIDEMPYLDVIAPFEIVPKADGESCLVVYHVRELPSTRFDGAGGLIRLKNKSKFVGQVNLEIGDILGTGRAFGLSWNRKDEFSSELKLNYLEPFILNTPFDMRLEAYQEIRDTLFIKTGGSVGFNHVFGDGLSGALWLTLQRTEPGSLRALASSNSRTVQINFDYDRTDYKENPRNGYGIGSEVDYKYRSNKQGVSVDVLEPDKQDLPTRLTSAGVNMRYFLNITGRFVTALKLSGWGIVNNNGTAPIDELHFLGGFDNLRGYAADRFPAYRYGMATIEPRLLAGRDGRIYLFTDIAAIKSSQDGEFGYHYYPGYGIGVAAPSSLGLFKFEVGWGKTGFPSESVFNFGIAGGF